MSPLYNTALFNFLLDDAASAALAPTRSFIFSIYIPSYCLTFNQYIHLLSLKYKLQRLSTEIIITIILRIKSRYVKYLFVFQLSNFDDKCAKLTVS